jgi:hypothetical protein
MIIIERTNTYAGQDYFDKLLWVAKAVSKDNIRVNLYKAIHVKDNICCSCDGFRMHIFFLDPANVPSQSLLPDGLYKIESMSKTKLIVSVIKDADFPNYWDVLEYKPVNGIPPLYCPSRKSANAMTLLTHHIFSRSISAYPIEHLQEAYMECETIMFERSNDTTKNILVMAADDRMAAIMSVIME